MNMTTMMMSNEDLLNKAIGRLTKLIVTTPDNYWRAMFATNLDFLKVYMQKGSEHEKILARTACYFIIDNADWVISTIDKQRFAVVIKNILLGIGIYTDDNAATD